MNKGKITEARWKRVRLTVRKMAIVPEALPRHFMMPNCLIPIHTAIRFPPPFASPAARALRETPVGIKHICQEMYEWFFRR